MPADDRAGDGKSETMPPGFERPRFFKPIERIENALQFGCRDARPRVIDENQKITLADRVANASTLPITNRILDDIAKSAPKSTRTNTRTYACTCFELELLDHIDAKRR